MPRKIRKLKPRHKQRIREGLKKKHGKDYFKKLSHVGFAAVLKRYGEAYCRERLNPIGCRVQSPIKGFGAKKRGKDGFRGRDRAMILGRRGRGRIRTSHRCVVMECGVKSLKNGLCEEHFKEVEDARNQRR